jgi:hypothetical protein
MMPYEDLEALHVMGVTTQRENSSLLKLRITQRRWSDSLVTAVGVGSGERLC